MPNERKRRQDKPFTAFQKTLPPAQKALLHVLIWNRGYPDIAIKKLYAKLDIDKPPQRYMQQRVGSIFSKLNPKLAPFNRVVRPGEKRGTYRLYRLPTE